MDTRPPGEQGRPAHGGRRPYGEVLAGLAAAILTAAVLVPWPRPSVPLRDACDLHSVGRFGAQCSLAQIESRSGSRWLRSSLAVYEDGVRLRQAAGRGDAIRVEPGSAFSDGETLVFSPIDGSDAHTNGRVYEVRPARFGGLWNVGEVDRRGAILAALLIGGALALLLRRPREARRLMWAAAVGVAAVCVAAETGAVLDDAPVHVDSGYALAAAEAVVRGAIPYRTLVYHYAPLGLYAFAGWSVVWPGPSPPPYEGYLALVLLAEAACAVLLFLFLRRAGCARRLSLLTAVSFLGFVLWWDGARILFEPLYLAPALLAAYAALAWTERRTGSLAAGAAASVSFLVKQYGGFVLWGLLGAALTDRDQSLRPGRLRQASTIAAGFAAGLAVLLIAVMVLGVRPGGLADQVIGPEYPRRHEVVWLKLFLVACPIAILAGGVPFLAGAWSQRAVRIAACVGLASLLPLYFRQHQYYFLNLCPWIFLLFALGVDRLGARFPTRAPAIEIAAMALLLAMPVRGAAALTTLIPRELREDQERRTLRMLEAWPSVRRTLLLLHPGFYHLTRYRSPDEAVLGYRFPNAISAEELRLGLRKAEGVWIDPRTMYAAGPEAVLRAAGSSLQQELRLNGYRRQTVVEDRFELWTRTAARLVRPPVGPVRPRFPGRRRP